MFRVCTFIENGTCENEWDYVFSNFQPDEIYLIGINNYQPTNNLLRDLPLHSTCDDLPRVPIVLFAPKTSRHYPPEISLEEFKFPSDAVYMFGPNNQHVSPDDFGNREPDHVVYIPTDTKDEMFNYVTYAVAAWHHRHG